jgi:hypothetical protein
MGKGKNPKKFQFSKKSIVLIVFGFVLLIIAIVVVAVVVVTRNSALNSESNTAVVTVGPQGTIGSGPNSTMAPNANPTALPNNNDGVPTNGTSQPNNNGIPTNRAPPTTNNGSPTTNNGAPITGPPPPNNNGAPNAGTPPPNSNGGTPNPGTTNPGGQGTSPGPDPLAAIINALRNPLGPVSTNIGDFGGVSDQGYTSIQPRGWYSGTYPDGASTYFWRFVGNEPGYRISAGDASNPYKFNVIGGAGRLGDDIGYEDGRRICNVPGYGVMYCRVVGNFYLACVQFNAAGGIVNPYLFLDLEISAT